MTQPEQFPDLQIWGFFFRRSQIPPLVKSELLQKWKCQKLAW